MSLCWLIFRAGNSNSGKKTTMKWMRAGQTSRKFRILGWKHAILLNISLESILSIYNDVIVLFNLYGWNSKCIYKTSKFITPLPRLLFPLPHLGPFLFSFLFPLPMTFSPFFLPYMPKICSIASNLFVFMEIQIFHILPGGSLSVQNHHIFLRGLLYATPIRIYGYIILWELR